MTNHPNRNRRYTLPNSKRVAQRHTYDNGLVEIYVVGTDGVRACITRQEPGMAWCLYVNGRLVVRSFTLGFMLRQLDMALTEEEHR